MISFAAKSSWDSEVVIRPPALSGWIDFPELFRFRNLLMSMARRQVKAEFGDLKLGILWVLARPLLMTGIFVWFRKLSSANVAVPIPYAAYLYSGLILWFFFTESLSRVAASINKDSGLMKKIYFPRLLSPLSGILSMLPGLGISLVPLFLIMLYSGIAPGGGILLLPLVLAQTMLLSLGAGCLFAVLITFSRDWERLLKLILYVGIFVSPVIYAPGMLPHAVQAVHMLNPMSGILLGFRAALFADFPLPVIDWFYSLGASLLIAFFGICAFRRAERVFLDRI